MENSILVSCEVEGVLGRQCSIDCGIE